VNAGTRASDVGRVIAGKWTLERLLGEGGMGSVYEARDAAGTRVAIKILHREMSSRQEVRERFLREGLAAGRVAHPGAVQTFEQAFDGETAYLVMELLEGRSLTDVINAEPMSPTVLFGYLEQVLDVLASAHAQGIVHRDLKPDNLFVTREGRLKVLDFGIAKFLDGLPPDQRTRTGIAMGTLSYMAPEQALGRGDQIDGRTDLYAVGALAFRILSGRRVHEGESDAEVLVSTITTSAPPLRSVAPEVPVGAGLIIDLCLRFDRQQRYPDAAVMRDDVRAFLQGAEPGFAKEHASLQEEPTSAGDVSIYVPSGHEATALSSRVLQAGGVPPTEPDAPSLARPGQVSRTLPDDLPPISAPTWFWLVAAAGLLALGGIIGLLLSDDEADEVGPELPPASSAQSE
jgi:serine/threonine-protein kinase